MGYRENSGTPDLREFDLVVLNTSAGKDSQVTIDVVVEAARAQGLEDRLVAVHADLGRVEWAGTRELAQEQAEAYGVRFEIAPTRPQGDLLDQIEARGMFPDSARRYCTSDHKRDQIAKVIRRLVEAWREETGEERPCRVLNAMGIRAEESPARAKKAPYQADRRLSTKAREVWTWFPIFDWTEDQVWERIRRSGVPHHEAYDLGMSRLSCVFCVFASKADLEIAARHNRELLADYARVERAIGHDFRKGAPISDLEAALENERRAA